MVVAIEPFSMLCDIGPITMPSPWMVSRTTLRVVMAFSSTHWDTRRSSVLFAVSNVILVVVVIQDGPGSISPRSRQRVAGLAEGRRRRQLVSRGLSHKSPGQLGIGISVQFLRIRILATCNIGRRGLSEDQQRQWVPARGFNKVYQERPGIATAKPKVILVILVILVNHGETKSHRTKAISDNPRATPGGKPANVYAAPGRTHVTRAGFQCGHPCVFHCKRRSCTVWS